MRLGGEVLSATFSKTLDNLGGQDDMASLDRWSQPLLELIPIDANSFHDGVSKSWPSIHLVDDQVPRGIAAAPSTSPC